MRTSRAPQGKARSRPERGKGPLPRQNEAGDEGEVEVEVAVREEAEETVEADVPPRQT